jgi:carboxyl-terminal processing protease
MRLKKILFSFLILVLLFLCYLAGFFIGYRKGELDTIYPEKKGLSFFEVISSHLKERFLNQNPPKVCKPEEIDFSLFWEAYHKLKEKFYDKTKIDPQKIIYGAISGMAKSSDDPYTNFFDPKQAKIFEEDVRGYFEGVGIEIGIKKGRLQVIAPLEGTPAQRAGIKAGDLILKINEKDTTDMSVEEAAMLIRGPKGTDVKLTIYREDWKEPKEIELTRDIIKIPSLKFEKKDGIFYLRIYQFSEKLNDDFPKIALEILKSDSKKLILDLRNNPGGILGVSVNIAGFFLEKGKLVVIEDYGEGKKIEHKSPGPGILKDVKTVILINGGSASASEILASALKENQGSILIGEKTFGKGSVQQLEKLSDGSFLKITVAKWLTPKGNQISDIGVSPDVEVKESESDEDLPLKKAIEIIKNF